MGVGAVESLNLLRGELPKFIRSGYGYGYGSGDGDGDGDGYGYGYGYGSGSGSGDGPYWMSTIQYFAAKWEPIQQSRYRELVELGATIAFWLSDAQGIATNGGSCAAVKPGDVHREPGPLRESCGRGQLHATRIPPKWEGDRLWLVALLGETRGDDEKLWGLTREIVGECL